jgi:hypothetical protein
MPGLVPGIHVLIGVRQKENVDGRDKPGHDGENASYVPRTLHRVRDT